jgi:cytochrome c peroxidase
MLLGLALAAGSGPAALAQATGKGLTAEAELGKAVFFDPQLSRNRNQSCASCHAPQVGWTGPLNHVNAATGVYEGSVPGRFGNRKPPSAAYAHAPVLHTALEDGETLFVGGHFWDGRATGERLGNPVAEQAQGPFVNPVEQALPDPACVVQRVCAAAYPVTLEALHPGSCAIAWPQDLEAACARDGGRVELDPAARPRVEAAYDRIALAVAAYERSPELNPFSSRYDHARAGRLELTAEERLGLEVFEGKGKCANCHVLDSGPDGLPPLLTDFTYDNLGVPRNPDNPWYRMTEHNPQGAAWVDGGLGESLAGRADWRERAEENLGKHKVPTLRNVDRRPDPGFVKAYMHNGYFKTLEGVVDFYNSRDVKPRCPGPLAESEALARGCWPEPEVSANVNTEELGDLGLTPEEEAALVAFMQALSDGVAATGEMPR